MKGFLSFIRWSIAVILSFLLTIVLSLAPLLVSTSLIITNRENPKQWIEGSGIYENAADLLVEALPVPKDADLDIPIDLDVTADLVSPEFAKETVEAAIDGIYDFLDGTTETLTISLGLDTFQGKYEEFLGQMASETFGVDVGDFNSLPACTTEQVAQLEAGNAAALSEPCLPPDIDLDALFKGTLETFESEESFLPGEKVGDEFQFSPEMNIAQDTLERVQYVYRIVEKLHWIILGILLVLVPLVIIITPSLKKGLNVVGSTGLLVGLTTVGMFLIYNYTGDKLMNFIKLTLESAGDLPIPIEYPMNILQSITTTLFEHAIIYSAIILGASILMLGIAALIKSESEPEEKEETEESKPKEKEYETKEKELKESTNTTSE